MKISNKVLRRASALTSPSSSKLHCCNDAPWARRRSREARAELLAYQSLYPLQGRKRQSADMRICIGIGARVAARRSASRHLP
eukprot:366374-Chlamydomonas_euryale.AAC.1